MVRVLAANTAALHFWQAAIRDYVKEAVTPQERMIRGAEWKVFEFRS